MIRGLGDYKKGDDDKKKKNTSSYVGGESSGLAVENENSIDALVERARQGGPSAASDGKKPELKITLYSNGFVVGDDAFRSYDNEES